MYHLQHLEIAIIGQRWICFELVTSTAQSEKSTAIKFPQFQCKIEWLKRLLSFNSLSIRKFYMSSAPAIQHSEAMQMDVVCCFDQTQAEQRANQNRPIFRVLLEQKKKVLVKKCLIGKYSGALFFLFAYASNFMNM